MVSSMNVQYFVGMCGAPFIVARVCSQSTPMGDSWRPPYNDLNEQVLSSEFEASIPSTTHSPVQLS